MAYSFAACRSHVAIDHASLLRRSTVPSHNRYLQHLGAPHVFPYMGVGHLSFASNQVVNSAGFGS